MVERSLHTGEVAGSIPAPPTTDYRFAGKRKTLALGVFPETSLAEAREKRDRARNLLSDDIDPGAQRKALKAAKAESAEDGFEAVAREWIARFSPNWAASHTERLVNRFERDVFPWIGARPVGEITAPRLLQVLRRIEARGTPETAHRRARPLDKSSGMPWPLDAPSAIRRLTCVARSRR